MFYVVAAVLIVFQAVLSWLAFSDASWIIAFSVWVAIFSYLLVKFKFNFSFIWASLGVTKLVISIVLSFSLSFFSAVGNPLQLLYMFILVSTFFITGYAAVLKAPSTKKNP